MPNECTNEFTIASHVNPDQLNTLIGREFNDFGEQLKIRHRWSHGISLRLITDWEPDFEFLEGLLNNYPECWVKNEWWEEGGRAGVWVGGTVYRGEKREIQRMEWKDMCIEGYNSPSYEPVVTDQE